jgi:esterase/lipase superfamily enzyme
VHRQYFKWWSKRLERDMELLQFGHAGARVLVFPTRCGRFYDYEDFGMLHSIRERIENGWMQLYCVDSIDHESFYCRDSHPRERVRRHQAYEDYILHEVLPLSEQLNPGSFLLAHGCSLGAFHAVNIALRHPSLFGKAVGFSGRYALTHAVGDFSDLFDGYFDDLVYFHSPLRFLAGAHEAAHLAHLQRLEITIAVGEHDPFLDSNRALSNTLNEKGIKNQLHIWQRRAHGRRSWQQMSHFYL